MKYIPADKLKAEIERRRLSNRYIDTEGYENELLEIITSLQQDKETLMLEMCNQSFWEDSGYIMIPPDVTIEGIESLLKQVKKKLQQEQPEPSNLVDVDAVREDFIAEVYRVLDADSTNDRANAIIDAFDSLPTIFQEQPEVDLDAIVDEAFDKYSSVDGYGQLSVSFNRAELYSFIKKIARKEE